MTVFIGNSFIFRAVLSPKVEHTRQECARHNYAEKNTNTQTECKHTARSCSKEHFKNKETVLKNLLQQCEIDNKALCDTMQTTIVTTLPNSIITTQPTTP
eukprot:5784335-Amphidinium_carterae.1